MNTSVDRLAVRDLEGRYQIGRTAVHNRIKALGLKTVKEGKRSFVTGDDLGRLDQLHDHLVQGGSMDSFINADEHVHYTNTEQEESLNQALATNQPPSLELFAQALAAAVAPKPDPLAYLDRLLWLAQNQVLLSTGELAELLGLSRETLKKLKEFERSGFRFFRDGKTGTQSAWKVSKS
jgi:DNA-binding transcriptional regulator YhcF (GntR family)